MLVVYVGLICEVVCKVIVVDLIQVGLFECEEDYVLSVFWGDCFGLIIELMLID